MYSHRNDKYSARLKFQTLSLLPPPPRTHTQCAFKCLFYKYLLNVHYVWRDKRIKGCYPWKLILREGKVGREWQDGWDPSGPIASVISDPLLEKIQNMQKYHPAPRLHWLPLWVIAFPAFISKIKWVVVREPSLNHIRHISYILFGKIQKQILLRDSSCLGLHPYEALGDFLSCDKCISEEFSRYQKLQGQSWDMNIRPHRNHVIWKNLVPMNLNKEMLLICLSSLYLNFLYNSNRW